MILFSAKIKKFSLLILIISGILPGKLSFGQTSEILLKAGYIEKFTHFIQWPESTDNYIVPEKFVIAVIGEKPIGEALSEIFSKSAAVKKEVEIVHLSSADQISPCMILFISGTENSNIDKILKYTSGKPILTIGDSKGFGAKGVIINMFYDGNYIRYEVNKSSLNKSGLIINSILLNYAVII